MFYFSEHNSWIKIGAKPKMTPDEAKQFFAERELVLPTEDKLDMDSLINTYWNR